MVQRSREVRLARRPAGALRTEDLEVVETDVPALAAGQVLVATITTRSTPPCGCAWTRSARPATCRPSGWGPVSRAWPSAPVVASRAAGFAEGDLVQHARGYRDLAVVDSARRRPRWRRHPDPARPRPGPARGPPRPPRRHRAHRLGRHRACRPGRPGRDRVGLGRGRRGGQRGRSAGPCPRLPGRGQRRGTGQGRLPPRRARRRRGLRPPRRRLRRSPSRGSRRDRRLLRQRRRRPPRRRTRPPAALRPGRAVRRGGRLRRRDGPGSGQPVPGHQQEPDPARLQGGGVCASCSGGALRNLADLWRRGELVLRQTDHRGIENTPRALVELLAGRNVGKTMVHL